MNRMIGVDALPANARPYPAAGTHAHAHMRTRVRMQIYIYIHVLASMRVRLCVVRMVCAPHCAGFAALDPFRQLLLGNAPWSEAQLAIRFAVSHAA